MDEARADGDDDDEGGNSEDEDGEYEDGSGGGGDKLLTGAAKENLDMMFTKLITHEDMPLNLGESTYFHDFMLEVSKGPYKGAPERLFSSVGLVKSDLRGRLLDSTLIDVMWAKLAP
jgi:hypothetical protein